MAASRETCPICGRKAPLQNRVIAIDGRQELGYILQRNCLRCLGDIKAGKVFFDGLSQYPVRLVYQAVLL